jgi:hypothetical protein
MDELMKKLLNKNKQPLKFVCHSLNLPMEISCGQNRVVPATMKRHFADLLTIWVS